MANFHQIKCYIQKREEKGRKGEIRRDHSKLGLSLLNREGCQVWSTYLVANLDIFWIALF